VLPCGVVPLYQSHSGIFTAQELQKPHRSGVPGVVLGAVLQDSESKTSLPKSEDLDLVGFRVSLLIG